MDTRTLACLAGIVAATCAGAARAAEVRVSPYGVTKDGHPVTAYTLINDKGASATILDYGGAIAAIRVPDRNGVLGNVVMSFVDLAAWETVGHANSIIGRYANRIKGGFTLDGVHYPLQQNAQGVTLHGGPPAYSIRVWSAQPIRKADGAAVTLALESPDGDQGFPGRLSVKATYRFGNDNALRLDLAATTDKPTVLNLTNHVYFNLNGNSTTPVYTHDLQVDADKTAVKDATGTPTGELQSVARTPFDFTHPAVIGDRLAAVKDPAFATAGAGAAPPPGTVRGYDHALVFSAAANRLDHVAIRLHDPASGRVLQIRTTETTVQVFTPAARNGVMSDVGKPFVPFPAVALETEHLPDSPNHPDFPSTVLHPGQTFRSTTIYAFGTDAGR